MDSKDILWNPRMTHQLVRERVLAGHELVLADVGMRGGIQQYWTMFRDQLRVIGFEPDEAECQRINSEKMEWKQTCFPVFLDSAPRRRQMFGREHNRAADGLHASRGSGDRYGVPHSNTWAAQGRITKHVLGEGGNWVTDAVDSKATNKETVEGLFNLTQGSTSVPIQTTTYEAVAREHNLPTPDFMKIDTEGAEYDILQGAKQLLGPDGVLGLEIEVRVGPLWDAPSFAEVCQFLAGYGYHTYNMSLTRFSRTSLPLQLDGNPLDHLNNPMIEGATTRGQIISADFLFFRDIILDDVSSPHRILKCAAMFEIYNLPDCAAELLIFYRNLLSSVIDVDAYIAQLIPDLFGRPVSHSEYIDLYKQRFGRFEANGA